VKLGLREQAYRQNGTPAAQKISSYSIPSRRAPRTIRYEDCKVAVADVNTKKKNVE
jgi:hypothetical protein